MMLIWETNVYLSYAGIICPRRKAQITCVISRLPFGRCYSRNCSTCQKLLGNINNTACSCVCILILPSCQLGCCCTCKDVYSTVLQLEPQLTNVLKWLINITIICNDSTNIKLLFLLTVVIQYNACAIYCWLIFYNLIFNAPKQNAYSG